MAASEGKPLMQHDEDLSEDVTASGCGCGCFRAFRFNHWRRGPSDVDDDDGGRLLGDGGGAWSWVAEKLKKAKEATEVIAGPKWKTFIRKISNRKQNNRFQFQYDEHSYALNFNSGANSEDDADMPPSFSLRFSAPPRRQPQSSSINSASL